QSLRPGVSRARCRRRGVRSVFGTAIERGRRSQAAVLTSLSIIRSPRGNHLMQRFTAIFVATTIGIGLAFAAPAFAAPRRAAPQSQVNQPGPPANNPNCVYRNGRLAGCDPDPNIRQRLEIPNYGPA